MRFVKTLIAFLLGSAAVGMAFQAKSDVNHMMRMITHHSGWVMFLSNFFTIGFGFMYVVNIGALFYSLLGLPCIRGPIFRERERETTTCRLIQCCLGPCCATYQQAIVAVTLFNQIMLSYLYMGVCMTLGGLLCMCHGGNAVVSHFQGLLDTYHSRNSYQAGSFSPVNWLMNLNVEKYCDATRGMNESMYQLFMGCVLSVISQVLMIMVISEEKGRIEGTMADGVIREDGASRSRRKRGDYSDSSSSDSEGERDVSQLSYYKPASIAGAGRNYNVPGGYQAGGARSLPTTMLIT